MKHNKSLASSSNKKQKNAATYETQVAGSCQDLTCPAVNDTQTNRTSYIKVANLIRVLLDVQQELPG